MKRIEIINSKLPKLDEEKELLEKSIKINQGTVIITGEHNEIVKRSLEQIFFIRDMYGNIDESELDKLTDSEFDELNKNIDLTLCPKQTYNDYFNASQNRYNDINGFTPILTSTGIATIGTVTSQCINFQKQSPNLFIDGAKILTAHNPKNELFDNTAYIRQELKKLNPDILDDFEYLVSKLNLFPATEKQYQDIIGARSLFFLNFIFNKQESTESNRRRDQIIQFVFGNTPYDNKADMLINQAMRLWHDLSSQDPNEPSVKIGNVTISYINSILTRVFGIIASLLKLRNSYYS